MVTNLMTNTATTKMRLMITFQRNDMTSTRATTDGVSDQAIDAAFEGTYLRISYNG